MAFQLVWLKAGELIGAWECARARGVPDHRTTVRRGEPVEQVDPNRERKLLARDAVDERLEDGREPRWLEPTHTPGERAEQRILLGDRRERRQIDAQPEEPFQVSRASNLVP